MPSPKPDAEHPSESSPWRKLLLGQLPLETETAVFVLMNMLDFFTTYWLMHTVPFHERNPVARFVLYTWGPVKGMLIYKLVLVTLVLLIAQVVAVKRLSWARFILIFGSIVNALLVSYSLSLYVRHG